MERRAVQSVGSRSSRGHEAIYKAVRYVIQTNRPVGKSTMGNASCGRAMLSSEMDNQQDLRQVSDGFHGRVNKHTNIRILVKKIILRHRGSRMTPLCRSGPARRSRTNSWHVSRLRPLPSSLKRRQQMKFHGER